MLSLSELYKLLKLNESLLKECTDWKRQAELLSHRSIVKDCIIEALNTELNFKGVG